MGIGDNKAIALPDGSRPDTALTVVDLDETVEDAVADVRRVVVDLLE
jgi:hypothetical protein